MLSKPDVFGSNGEGGHHFDTYASRPGCLLPWLSTSGASDRAPCATGTLDKEIFRAVVPRSGICPATSLATTRVWFDRNLSTMARPAIVGLVHVVCSRPETLMELSFRTRTLRSLCESEDKAAALYGVEVAAALRRRLADLRAARTVEDLVAGKRWLDGHEQENLHLGITGGHELHCKPNHRNPPRDEHGLIAWGGVHRLQVVDIEERHDG